MATEPQEYPSPPQFTLRSLFVLTTVTALLLGILVPWVRSSRDAARTLQCASNLRWIGAGLLEYQNSFGQLPPAYTADAAGQPLHSWRTPLLPFMEQLDGKEGEAGFHYADLHWNESWDSPNNSQFFGGPFPFFHCPDDDAATEHNHTSYLAVIGAGTPWPGRTAAHLPSAGEGAAETVLVVEAADSGIHWMEPRDLKLDGLDYTLNGPSTPGISSKHTKGVNVLFIDGSVRCLPRDTPASSMQAMLMLRESEGSPEAGLKDRK